MDFGHAWEQTSLSMFVTHVSVIDIFSFLTIDNRNSSARPLLRFDHAPEAHVCMKPCVPHFPAVPLWAHRVVTHDTEGSVQMTAEGVHAAVSV